MTSFTLLLTHATVSPFLYTLFNFISHILKAKIGRRESCMYKEKRLNTELKLREAFHRNTKMADKSVSRQHQSQNSRSLKISAI